jgi:hypothetical protein
MYKTGSEKPTRRFVIKSSLGALLPVIETRLGNGSDERESVPIRTLVGVGEELADPFRFVGVDYEQFPTEDLPFDSNHDRLESVRGFYYPPEDQCLLPFPMLSLLVVTGPSDTSSPIRSQSLFEMATDELNFEELRTELGQFTESLVQGYQRLTWSYSMPEEEGGQGHDVRIIQKLPDGILVVTGSTPPGLPLVETSQTYTTAAFQKAHNHDITIDSAKLETMQVR